MIVTTLRLASLALAAVVALGTAPADAARFGEPASVVGRHGDLDLATTRGVARLNNRIRAAAGAVCGNADARDLAGIAEARKCRIAAIAGATQQVQLAVARARSGGERLAAIAVAVP